MNIARSLMPFRDSHIVRIAMILTLGNILDPSMNLFAQGPQVGETGKKQTEQTNLTVENPFPNRHPAPELDGGIEWLNAAGPISLKDLRGKVVLIDFWTFCCINCMHILPDLAYLEKKYPNELVVVGVHSAKFDNEKESGNIRKAILRYEIEHPVVNDANMTIWGKFGVNSWPSLVVLDPEGQYCGYVSGEGNRELLEKVIDRLIEYHKAKGTLDTTAVHFDLERSKSQKTSLRFPGKIFADGENKRLFVSDSNHHRIVVCDFDGKLVEVIGSGKIGKKDGRFADAEFDHPQGMTLVGESLYIADTENHLLRLVDLKTKFVSTFAGTGLQDRTRHPGGSLRETPLNSPWDLTVVDGVLYVAMAGPHQIWAHKLGTNSISIYAGSGREDIRNGELDQSALAQPSGIANDGKQLYVVDSEGSAVRKISTDPQNELSNPSGNVTTVAGTHDLPRGRSLFEFGDVDKGGDEARFQHPIGIAYHEGELFVADSYNHKIRRVDLKSREVTTWAGSGKPGTELDPLQLAEPAGIAISGSTMFVADTNNHRIVAIDMKSKKAREFVIDGLNPPKEVEIESSTVSEVPADAMIVKQRELKPGDAIPFEIDFAFPDGYKRNLLFPVAYRLKIEGEESLVPAEHQNVKHSANSDGGLVMFKVPTNKSTGQATLVLSLTYGYCREGNGGVCKVATTHWKIPVTLVETAKATSVKLTATTK